MNITISQSDKTAVATITGDITHAVTGEFQAGLLSAFGSAGGLVLDFAGIGLLTSAGLRTLLLLYREARQSGKNFVLAAVPDYVRDVMSVTGFWEQFVAYDTVEQAVAAIS
ncbi:MAG: STAS domain-containing protein [Chlorobiaceae bacterium]|nr:STAS domain-containing protein [Chlorobiaceae bacterium]